MNEPLILSTEFATWHAWFCQVQLPDLAPPKQRPHSAPTVQIVFRLAHVFTILVAEIQPWHLGFAARIPLAARLGRFRMRSHWIEVTVVQPVRNVTPKLLVQRVVALVGRLQFTEQLKEFPTRELEDTCEVRRGGGVNICVDGFSSSSKNSPRERAQDTCEVRQIWVCMEKFRHLLRVRADWKPRIDVRKVGQLACEDRLVMAEHGSVCQRGNRCCCCHHGRQEESGHRRREKAWKQ